MERPLVPIPLARGSKMAVVAPHHLASAAGLEILAKGGSAVDAAIATNAVLAVVYGSACGLGGDAFWLIWDPRTQAQVGLNGSGRSGLHTSVDDLAGRGIDRVPLRGGLSITVPGAVRSWSDAHSRYGRLEIGVLLSPAIELAEAGFPAWELFIEAVERSAPIFAEALGSRAPWFSVYRPAGRPWRLGERVRLPALAATLRRLTTQGWDDFYLGQTATYLTAALAGAGASISRADIEAHESTWTCPISTDYRGVTVTAHPPNSSGFVALEILNILEGFEPPPPVRFSSGQGADLPWTHLGIEAAKLALADRDAHLTDPMFYDAPVDRLVDKQYAAELARKIRTSEASIPPATLVPRRGGTVSIGAVDGDGMAVSLIESNYMTFGSGVVDPETGVVFQNRGSYFSLDPVHPNVLAPGKRTLHTLMPGMLMRAGRPWVIVGSMGGDAQPQVHAQVVSALVDGRVDVGTAVGQPRWFVQPQEHFAHPIDVVAEARFAPGVLEGLESYGHAVTRVAAFDGLLGHCHAIELVDGGPTAGGTLVAATDPRSAGLPAVW